MQMSHDLSGLCVRVRVYVSVCLCLRAHVCVCARVLGVHHSKCIQV
jgi:hypothetical protein